MDSRLDKGTGHHVAQTTSGARNDTDFTVHGERCEGTLGVSSVASSLDVVSWVVVGPFLGERVSGVRRWAGEGLCGGLVVGRGSLPLELELEMWR